MAHDTLAYTCRTLIKSESKYSSIPIHVGAMSVSVCVCVSRYTGCGGVGVFPILLCNGQDNNGNNNNSKNNNGLNGAINIDSHGCRPYTYI